MNDGKRAVVLYGQFKSAKLKDGKNAFLFPNKYEFNAVNLKDETDSLFKIKFDELFRWMISDDFDFGMQRFKRNKAYLNTAIDNEYSSEGFSYDSDNTLRGFNLTNTKVMELSKSEYVEKWFQLANVEKNAFIYCFKSDFPMIYDYRNLSVPFHITKLRKVHFCKHCNWYYRSGCRCVKNHTLKGYERTNVNEIFDISNKGKVHTLNQRIAKKGVATFGIEYEVNMPNENKSRNEHSLSVFNFMKNNKMYDFCHLFQDVKDDSSIGRGAEFVSLPFTSTYYQARKKDFAKLSNAFFNLGMRGGTNCGLHIHIGRSSFKNVYHIYRWLKLMVSSSEQLRLLSGRGRTLNYCRFQIPTEFKSSRMERVADNLGYASTYTSYTTDKQLLRLAKEVLLGYQGGGRDWINFQNERTIELRFPTSTTDSKLRGKKQDNYDDWNEKKYYKLNRHIEMAIAMVEYSKVCGINETDFQSFLNWLKNDCHTYNNLFYGILDKDEILEITFKNSKKVKLFMRGIGQINDVDITNINAIRDMSQRAMIFADSIESLSKESSEDISKEIADFKKPKTKKKAVKKKLSSVDLVGLTTKTKKNHKKNAECVLSQNQESEVE